LEDKLFKNRWKGDIPVGKWIAKDSTVTWGGCGRSHRTL